MDKIFSKITNKDTITNVHELLKKFNDSLSDVNYRQPNYLGSIMLSNLRAVN